MEFIERRHVTASVSPQSSHAGLKRLYHLTQHSNWALRPDVAPQCLQHVGSVWLRSFVFLDTKTVTDASNHAGSKAFMSSCSPAWTAHRDTYAFLTAIVRHAKWTGTNDESDLTGSKSLNFAPPPSIFFSCILIFPNPLKDKFSRLLTVTHVATR